MLPLCNAGWTCRILAEYDTPPIVDNASSTILSAPAAPLLQHRSGGLCGDRADPELHHVAVVVPVVPVRPRRGHPVPVLDRRRQQRLVVVVVVVVLGLRVPEPAAGVPARDAGAAAPVGGLRRDARHVRRPHRVALRPRRVLAVQHLPAGGPQPVPPRGVAAVAHAPGRQPHLLRPLLLRGRPRAPPRGVPRGRRQAPLVRVLRRRRARALRLRGAVPERHRHARAAEVPARHREHHQEPAGRHRARAQHGVRAELEARGGRGVRTVRECRRPVRAPSAGGAARGLDLRVLPRCGGGEPSVDFS
jgi:hypothetical protein